MTEERQPNTRPGLDTKHFEPVNAERQPNTELREKAANWPLTSHLSNLPPDDGRLWRTWDVVAFAASIQAEAQQQIEELNFEISRLVGKVDAAQRGETTAHEAQYQAEKQLAEARAQVAEIHNRFCGENGEPCQVCRLKAEREEKK